MWRSSGSSVLRGKLQFGHLSSQRSEEEEEEEEAGTTTTSSPFPLAIRAPNLWGTAAVGARTSPHPPPPGSEGKIKIK